MKYRNFTQQKRPEEDNFQRLYTKSKRLKILVNMRNELVNMRNVLYT